jgi:hypothetical protein
MVEVLRQRRTPMIDGGLAGSSGGQIGAGLLVPDLDCFRSAYDSYRAQYDPINGATAQGYSLSHSSQESAQ